jgi:hypothetical protein
MSWRGSFLVLSIVCPKSFLYLDDHYLPQDLGNFPLLLNECLSYAFSLHLFFYAQDS